MKLHHAKPEVPLRHSFTSDPPGGSHI